MTRAPAEIDLLMAPTRTDLGAATHNTPFAALLLDSHAEVLPMPPQKLAEIAAGTVAQAVSLVPKEPEGSVPGTIA